ncbi:hypothetical protein [Roseovarius salis]|uniref:hypothetical protein n=1 Tax=Roseovarius salis TaxID=3376063 RepID=UPI0037C5A6E3
MRADMILDRLALLAILLTLLASLVIWQVAPVAFSTEFAAEDKLVENATALFLFAAAVLLAWRARRFHRAGAWGAAGLSILYALLFFFASGEEISWGQRLFGWGTPEFFARHNYQQETNLHNLMVGEHRLARTLFGSVLTTVLLLYLVVLPLLYTRFGALARLADRLAVPVPWPRHGLIAILASLVVAVIDVPRNWEVYELVFSLLACSIFLRPQRPSGVVLGG